MGAAAERGMLSPYRSASRRWLDRSLAASPRRGEIIMVIGQGDEKRLKDLHLVNNTQSPLRNVNVELNAPAFYGKQ